MNFVKHDQLTKVDGETTTFGNHGFLPEDLINEILLRLPVKSLLRFRTVCNLWHKIITSSRFVHDHLHHEANPSCHLVQLLVESNYSRLCLNLYKVPLFIEEDNPEPPGSIIHVWGPCNGILCVQLINRSLVLWNPATRSSWGVPDCPLQLSGATESAIGFGLLDDEFKIVLLPRHHNCPYFAIFNSNSNSWRLFEETTLVVHANAARLKPFNIDISTSDSCSYWLKYEHTSPTPASIVAFNFRTELFQEIPLPQAITKEYATLDSYNGFLAVFLSYSNWSGRGFIHIWFMKEQGCWTKLETVNPPFQFWYPMGFWKANEILLARPTVAELGEIVAYNLDSGTTRTFEYQKIIRSRHTMLCRYPYKESLVSVIRKTLD